MLRIDAHNHFWNYDPVVHDWIDDDMQAIRRNFLPADFESVLRENGFDGSIAVQADQSEGETDFLLGLAESNDFIKGVVGWADLRSENIDERLEYYHAFSKLKGFRHV